MFSCRGLHGLPAWLPSSLIGQWDIAEAAAGKLFSDIVATEKARSTFDIFN